MSTVWIKSEGCLMNHLETGVQGEAFAAEYLEKKGYLILQKNYKNKIGEIDIIAQTDETLVFVEVKTRRGLKYGYAFEAVDIKKRNKIIKTSQLYLVSHQSFDIQCRYDIIEVYLGRECSIHHIIDAF